MPAMTLLEITYQLQEPLTPHQLGALGEFANTYGLRRFRVDEPLRDRATRLGSLRDEVRHPVLNLV